MIGELEVHAVNARVLQPRQDGLVVAGDVAAPLIDAVAAVQVDLRLQSLDDAIDCRDG